MILTKNKSIVPNKNITYFLNPDYIYVPAKNIYVKDGEYVYKNQIIADKTSSSVSGKVLGIKKCNIMGKLKNTLVIQNDYREYFKDNNMKMKITIPNMLKILEKDKVLFDKFKSSKTFDNIVLFAINDNPYVYNEVFGMENSKIDQLIKNLLKDYRFSSTTFQDADEEDQEFLKRFSFICLMSFDVYIKKMIIERMIDDISAKEDDKKSK